MHQLLPDTHAYLVRAIGNSHAANLLPPGKRATIGQLAEIPMAARHGNHRAGRVDARADDCPIVDGAFEAEYWPANIADSGEAPHQRILRLGAGDKIVGFQNT